MYSRIFVRSCIESYAFLVDGGDGYGFLPLTNRSKFAWKIIFISITLLAKLSNIIDVICQNRGFLRPTFSGTRTGFDFVVLIWEGTC